VEQIKNRVSGIDDRVKELDQIKDHEKNTKET
jgi:hypothetical protein